MVLLTGHDLRTVHKLLELDIWEMRSDGNHVFCEPLASIHNIFWQYHMSEALHGGFYKFTPTSLVKYQLGSKVNGIIARNYWDSIAHYEKIKPSQWVDCLNDILVLVQTHNVKLGTKVEKNLVVFEQQVVEIFNSYGLRD